MSNGRVGLAIALAVVALVACSRPPAGSAGAPPMASSLPLIEYMAHVIEPNAKQLWRWQGFVVNEKGVTNFEPKNDAEWEEAESAGLTLAELTYALHQPARRRTGQDNWDKRVSDLRDAAARAATAAERRDLKTFSDAVDQVNTACVECHYAFAPHLEAPRPAN